MSKQEIPYKIYLTENELPKEWYNVRADMRTDHRPLLNPATHEPVTLAELEPVFCTELAKQELNDKDAYIEIPKPVRDFYKMYRPSPLVRAYCLEKYLDTPAEIYYKFEGNNTSGSHKLNSAIAQAYYAKEQGLTGVTTETGAGQWGTALSMACGYFGLDLTVYMVRCSYEQKPQRRTLMNVYGANVIPSPSDTTAVGRKMLAEHPDNTGGSLGTAISEAVEVALTKPNTRYVLGSVLNQVVLHQSVIGLESKTAMEKYGVYPDMVIGCAGGGSNLGGLMAPFMRDKLKGERDPYFIAVEPMSCPSLTRGKFAYDFCDTGKVTPLAKMYTLGSGFMPAPSHPLARGRTEISRHEPHPQPALPRRLHQRGESGEPSGRVQGGDRVRESGRHPSRARVRTCHQGHSRRSAQVQGDGGEEGHPLRSHRHGIFRHDLLRPLYEGRAQRRSPHGRIPRGRRE